jgi:hypothetical protein
MVRLSCYISLVSLLRHELVVSWIYILPVSEYGIFINVSYRDKYNVLDYVRYLSLHFVQVDSLTVMSSFTYTPFKRNANIPSLECVPKSHNIYQLIIYNRNVHKTVRQKCTEKITACFRVQTGKEWWKWSKIVFIAQKCCISKKIKCHRKQKWILYQSNETNSRCYANICYISSWTLVRYVIRITYFTCNIPFRLKNFFVNLLSCKCCFTTIRFYCH